MRRHKHSLTAMIAGGTVLATALVAGPAASAQTTEEKARQTEKNNMRNLGTGLGAAAILEALRGKGTNALILGAGAAYSYKKYDDARKAQEKEEQLRNNNRRYGYNNYGESSRMGTASSASMAAPGPAPIDVYVNDEPVRFSDQRPEMTAGNVYVPMRGVLEKIGANVQWDAQSRSVVAMQGDKTVRMPVNGMATLNGQRMTLDTPAYIDKGRTMVPLRFLAETFGAQVAWDAQDRDVRISTAGERDAG